MPGMEVAWYMVDGRGTAVDGVEALFLPWRFCVSGKFGEEEFL